MQLLEELAAAKTLMQAELARMRSEEEEDSNATRQRTEAKHQLPHSPPPHHTARLHLMYY
jgi:hypothetical protein